MPAAAKKCAFCDNPAVSKGGEHLWDNWLNEKLPRKTRFHAKKQLSINSPSIEFGQVGLKEQVPAVCQKCNERWMSALTGRVKQRFSASILDGAPFTLDTEDAVTLAAFTLLKAIVKNYVYGNDDPFFTRETSAELRKTLAIPAEIKMWVAAYQGSSRYAFHSNFYTVDCALPPLKGMEFFCYTYIANNLVLQLLAPRWKDVGNSGKPLLTFTPSPNWQPATVQFWPPSSETLLWPPEKYLGDSTIKEFIQRFQVPVNLHLWIPHTPATPSP